MAQNAKVSKVKVTSQGHKSRSFVKVTEISIRAAYTSP